MPSNSYAKLRIGTHNGKFHADELVACAMLKQLPEYANAEIVRSRDQSMLSTCTVVVDVGGVFDPVTHRYDHHQRGFELTFKSFFKDSEWNIKLSSAGLVYVHFGPQILANVVGVQESHPMISVLFNKVLLAFLFGLFRLLQIYGRFIVELDAVDNGIPMTEDSVKYTINTGLSARVGLLNPQWNQKDADETKMPSNSYAKLRIGTHNGKFHADELVACAMLKQLPEYANAEIVRSRDQSMLSTCTVVVDIYGRFIVELDAVDNGIPMTEDSVKYTINTGLSARVGLLNPQWNQKDADETVCFMNALSMVEEEFIRLVRHYAESWYPARELVAQALKKRWQVDPSGHIFSLEQQPCPWAAHLHELEKIELEQKNMEPVPWDVTDSSTVSERPVFCLYQRDDGHWSVQSVAVSETESFKNRVSLLEPWRGLRDEELSKVVGLPGCIFVHATGFLGIHKTREGALHMARASLKSSNFSD
ncbi:hypothetical protein AHF37_02007 [Paragonimus kellicotti]|nr:hypothetical protein AHF37_02007 [Paragonimus kellicotti]